MQIRETDGRYYLIRNKKDAGSGKTRQQVIGSLAMQDGNLVPRLGDGIVLSDRETRRLQDYLVLNSGRAIEAAAEKAIAAADKAITEAGALAARAINTRPALIRILQAALAGLESGAEPARRGRGRPRKQPVAQPAQVPAPAPKITLVESGLPRVVPPESIRDLPEPFSAAKLFKAKRGAK